MEMRPDDRTKSKKQQRWAAKSRGWGVGGVVRHPETCFNLLKLLCQQAGLNPISPFHVSSSSPVLPKPTMGNVNKLGFGDWINPFRRARSHEDNLSITGQIQTGMLEREWHFNARLSLKQSHTSTEDTSEWNMGRAEQKRGLIYLPCVILHRSHYQLFVMDAYFLLQWKMAIGAVWYCKIGTYNVLQSKTKAHLHSFQALNLIFLCANLACLNVCGESWRKACWYAGDTGKQRYGGARYRCRIDAMRSTVVKSIWPPSMRDRSREQKRGERLRGKGGYRSDACSNKLMSGSAYKEQCCLGNAGSQSLVFAIGILLSPS